MVAELRGGSAAPLVDALTPLILEEIAKVVKTVLQEQISERIRKHIIEQATEVLKTSSRDRTLQRAVEQIPDVSVPEMVTQLLEVPKIVPQDRILQQTVEQVASNREASVKVFSEELKALAEATQVLQSETSGADGQPYSLLQESSSAALRTSTYLKGFELVMLVRRLAEQEHSTTLAQPESCVSATMKFGAGADGDPFVKVKDLITDLISRVEAEASSETNQKSYCDEEMSKATEKRQDLEADVTKHSSKLEAAVARFVDLMKEVPVVMQQQMPVQRQVPRVQTVPKTVETPQLQCVDQVVDDPVVQIPRVQVLEKTAEIPQLQTVEKIGEIPQNRTIQGTQAPESLAITPVCQVRQTGHVEELVEVSKVLSPDTVQQRFGRRMIEIPAETQMIQSARTSESSVTAPVCQTTQVEIGEVTEIGASISRRIRFFRIRHSTCL